MKLRSDKLTKMQEEYVQNLLLGDTQRTAYRKAYPSSRKWSDGAVDAEASRCFSIKKVRKRYDILREKIDTKVENKFMLTIENILEDILDTRAECRDNMRKKNKWGETVLDQAAVNGRNKTNELLGKYKKMFTEKVEVKGTVAHEVVINIGPAEVELDE